MKNLVDRLINESKGWTYCNKNHGADFSWKANKQFLWMSTEGETYGFMSEHDIKAFEDDYEGADEDIKNILSLQPGEMFSPDGDINIYIRIQK